MRIGILGNGLMAEALGRHWVKAGHDVMIGGRSLERAAVVAGRIGATTGSLQEATTYGEVLLLAVPAEAAVPVLTALDIGAGRILIDCTNAVNQQDFTLAEPAMAEAISRAVPEVHVVKAFNLAADAVWRDAPEGLGVPICGDDPVALEQVGVLVRDVGCEPVVAGRLARARLLEATAALAIGVWVSGGDVRGLFPPLEAAFGSASLGNEVGRPRRRLQAGKSR
jgi:predicted dinucleotide-binding enzyme